jgi:hypothetical protein
MMRAITFTMLTTLVTLAGPAQAQTKQWKFRALLDGKPIGTHTFTLTGTADDGELRSEAKFDVRILFIPAYRYRHLAMERWHHGCLASITAKTDDDGNISEVEGRSENGVMTIATHNNRYTTDGCVLSFAYWNPDMLRQTRLLNAQTGDYQAVSIASLADDRRGTPGREKRYRISGPKQPIELRYSDTGEWIGLDTIVGGGRHLAYQLEP